MKLEVDSHTHSISSGHAYSTIRELAEGAAANGIKMIAVTDHGPALLGAPSLPHFWNLKILPETIGGVRVLKGAELNIINYDGEVDIPDRLAAKLDFVIASFHDYCITPSSVEAHTGTMISVLKNPYIDAVAHPGNPQFQVDIEKVVEAARQYGKLIEINNHSFRFRSGSEPNCREFVLKCKRMGVRIVCGSDAHVSFDVGRFDRVYPLLDETGMPEELVLNTSVDKFEEYLKEKRKRIGSSRLPAPG